jgi:hypothetical protein
MEQQTQKQYVVRKQSNFAHTYGLGETVSEGVTLFRAGNYDLTQDELEVVMKKAKVIQ